MFKIYNNLGITCIIFIIINLILAFYLSLSGSYIAVLNIISAFFCNLGLLSSKCKKNI